MTIRTFWTILIKILGIWLVLESIIVIHQLISSLTFFGFNNGDDSIFDAGLVVVLLLLTIGIYFFILRLFLFKTAWLIDKLHLEKGFEEDRIDLNMQSSAILSIATIIIGGLMFIDGLPEFCRQVIAFFQEKNLFRESPTTVWIIFNLIKTLIGYLLMTNSKSVVAFIERQREKN